MVLQHLFDTGHEVDKRCKYPCTSILADHQSISLAQQYVMQFHSLSGITLIIYVWIACNTLLEDCLDSSPHFDPTAIQAAFMDNLLVVICGSLVLGWLL